MDWMGTLGPEGVERALIWLSNKGVTAKGAGAVLDRMCLTEDHDVETAFEAVKPA